MHYNQYNMEFLDINIQENDDKFGMVQKLSSLLDKLKKITSGLARYFRFSQVLHVIKKS